MRSIIGAIPFSLPTWVVAACLLLHSVHGQTPRNPASKKLEYVSWIMYTPVEFLDVQNDFLFASSNALVTLDVADKKNPKEASRLRPMEPGVPSSIVTHNDYAFVGWGAFGMRVIDVREKRRPVIVVDSFFAGVKFSNFIVQYPYLVAFMQRSVNDISIGVIDITSAVHPTLTGSISLQALPGGMTIDHYPFRFIMDKNEIFLTCGPRGKSGTAQLHVIDISSPQKPVYKSSLAIGEVRSGGFREKPHLAMAKRDSVLYVTGPFNDGPASDIKIIRTSRLAPPAVVTGWFGRINAGDIDIDGASLFITDRNARLFKLDITNPLLPVFVDSLRLPVPSYYALDFQVRVEGGYAYMHMWDFYAVFIIDASGPTLSVVSEIPFGHALNDLTASGSYLFTSVWDYYQMYVLNMYPPEMPHIVRRQEALGYGWGNDVKGKLAYLAMGDNTVEGATGGLHIYDVSDPLHPVFRGHNPPHNPGIHHDVDVCVDTTVKRAYVVIGESKNWEDGDHKSDNGGLRIVDVRDPAKPVTLGSYILSPEQQGKAICASGNIAFLATSAGVYIIDAKDPSQPRLAAVWGPGKRYARGLDVEGRYLYAAYANTLAVLDISDPNAPALRRTYELHAQANDVVFDSARVYAATFDGLYVFDASDPLSLQLVDSVRNVFASSPQYLAIGNGHIYVATNSGGIYTFRLSDMTGIEEEINISSPRFALLQNYPNPFSRSTAIGYRLSKHSRVRLEVLDIFGRKVATLVDEEEEAGEHTATFVLHRYEFMIPSGVYFYRLITPMGSITQIMTHLR